MLGYLSYDQLLMINGYSSKNMKRRVHKTAHCGTKD